MATRPATDSGFASNPSAPAGHGPLRILLAEDNCIAAELLCLMGRKLGARMDWVENGLDAVDSVHRARNAGTPYALVMMDAMMPVLSGPEAVRRLRAGGIAPSELPVVAVTAATAPDEIRDFLDAGMQAYLAKPVSIADFSACLDAWAPDHSNSGATGGARSPSALRKRYELRKAEVFARLEEAADRTGRCPDDERADLRNHLHKLAGIAGSFGEDALSKAAAQGAVLLAEAEPEALDGALGTALELLKDARAD